jgi:hypothetical protein
MLNLVHRIARLIEWYFPFKAMEDLDGLQGILLDARPNGAFQNCVKIDETARAEHPVNFVLPCGVTSLRTVRDSMNRRRFRNFATRSQAAKRAGLLSESAGIRGGSP